MVLAIAYLLLVIRQNLWCWLCAGVSSAIYVWLFFAARLYMESLLYLFYVAMALYGWWAWVKGAGGKDRLPVTKWSLRTHAMAAATIALLTTVAGMSLRSYTDAAYPYIDSFTTFSAIWATFLVARKVFENWWYWLLIDTVSIVIYWLRGLELTALLFVVYIVLIPFGILQWQRAYRLQAPAGGGVYDSG